MLFEKSKMKKEIIYDKTASELFKSYFENIGLVYKLNDWGNGSVIEHAGYDKVYLDRSLMSKKHTEYILLKNDKLAKSFIKL